MRTSVWLRWHVVLGIVIAVAALGAVTYRGIHRHDGPPVLGEIDVPEARTASRRAVVHAMGGTLFSATIPLPGHRHFDSAVPAWVGPAFGVDPPEVRQVRLVADDVTALTAWVDIARKQVIQIETDGLPFLYRWIGKPPPLVPGD